MENLTLYLTIAQWVIFTSYIAYTVSKFGIPASISDTWYLLERKGVLFTLFCWSLGVCMLYQGNDKSIFFVLSGVGLSFVGGATMFKWKGAYTDKIHGAGAAIGIVCALLGLYIDYEIRPPFMVFSGATILISLLHIKNHIFWMEIVAFACVISGLLYRFI
jgi:hypothetical protein